MTDLSPETRALLDEVRAAHEPAASAAARVQRRVLAAVAAGGVGLGATAGASAGTAGVTSAAHVAGLSLGAKVLIGSALLASLGAGVTLGRVTTPSIPVVASAPSATMKTPTSPSLTVPALTASPDSQLEAPPENRTFTQEALPVHSTPTPAGPASGTARPPGVRTETDLLRRAMQAAAAGDTEAANRALSEHARVFPTGMLVEEREAQRTLLTCTTHKGQAGSALAAFSQRFPGSVHLPRLTSACAR